VSEDPAPAVVRRTQWTDVARSVPLGFLLALESSVLLTIAIKHFEAPGWAKGSLAAANGVGLLASPFLTALARRIARPVMVVAATVSVAGAIGFALATTGSLAAYLAGGIVGIAAVHAVVPLMTLTYQRNFPVRERGRRVGWGMTVKVAVSALAGLGLGGFLVDGLHRWWWVVVVAAVALLTAAACQAATPSVPLDAVPGRRNRPWPHVGLLAEDRRLRLTLIAWMFMGFGNLMLLPLRVEYLAEPGYGIGADAATITLLTVTVPSVCRLVSLPVFGLVFDRLSFFSSRIVVNVLFAAYVAAFFTGTSSVGLVAGAVVLGIASAGGDLMWNLWVTKFAPPDRVADYMGLHTFSTGLRAVAAPLVGFAVIERLPLGTVAALAAGMMVVASMALVPEARAERALRARSAVAT
jgi:MFS family permease